MPEVKDRLMNDRHSQEANARGGLEGIEVADTELSHVDGARGELILRGHRVEDLAGAVSFEEAVGLFLDGALASPERSREIAAKLAAGRVDAFERLGRLGDALEAPDAMDALRTATSHLTPNGACRNRFRLIGAISVFAAAWARRRAALAPIAPSARRSHAADLLAMLGGGEPSAASVAALDAYLVAIIDHGMNASTFAARVVASTGSDLTSAVVAAIGALKGPLHGGAPGPVLDMLDAIGRADRARAWLEAELAAGRRIMGLGHRIYRVRDPRAAVLERALTRFAEAESSPRLVLARAVEREAVALLAERHPERALKVNVEFYTAVLLEALGVPRPLFSAIFACGRAAGWCAHVDEQRRAGRLIRPSARYVGPRPSATSCC